MTAAGARRRRAALLVAALSLAALVHGLWALHLLDARGWRGWRVAAERLAWAPPAVALLAAGWVLITGVLYGTKAAGDLGMHRASPQLRLRTLALRLPSSQLPTTKLGVGSWSLEVGYF